jgi:head-tail adaptor
MTIVEQSPREIIFRVRWSRDLKATLRFRFKQADWPDSFQATVTEINGSEEYDTDMYSFVRIKTGRPP